MALLSNRELARLGAAIRIKELEAELASIVAAFPDIKRSRAASEAHVTRGKIKQARKRSRMSAEARKAVSVRMKKYWAARRAKKT